MLTAIVYVSTGLVCDKATQHMYKASCSECMNMYHWQHTLYVQLYMYARLYACQYHWLYVYDRCVCGFECRMLGSWSLALIIWHIHYQWGWYPIHTRGMPTCTCMALILGEHNHGCICLPRSYIYTLYEEMKRIVGNYKLWGVELSECALIITHMQLLPTINQSWQCRLNGSVQET